MISSAPIETPSARRPTRAVQPRLLCLALALAPAPAVADCFAIAPGSYDITARMVMPHLEEMRRTVTHEQRCLADGDPVALFPVLRQSALQSCALSYGAPDADAYEYVLVCATARVATGTARLTRSGDRIIGVLDVKMGGKNITFSQRVEAVLRCACGAPQ